MGADIPPRLDNERINSIQSIRDGIKGYIETANDLARDEVLPKRTREQWKARWLAYRECLNLIDRTLTI